jgi:hypothetical protein
MIGLAACIAMGLAYVAVQKIEKANKYKPPKGKHKNRYK